MEFFQNNYQVESIRKTTTETVTITKSLQDILLTTSSYRVDLAFFAGTIKRHLLVSNVSYMCHHAYVSYDEIEDATNCHCFPRRVGSISFYFMPYQDSEECE